MSNHDTIILRNSDKLRLRFKQGGHEFNYSTSVSEVEGNILWLYVPRDGALLVQLHEGLTVNLIIAQSDLGLSARVNILKFRTNKLRKEFCVAIPKKWNLLARRESPRIHVEIPVYLQKYEELKYVEDHKIPGTITDMSVTGSLIHSRAPMRQGQLLSLMFNLSTKSKDIVVLAQVNRMIRDQAGTSRIYDGATGSYHFGAKFLKLKENDLKQLEEYITTHSTANSAYLLQTDTGF